MMSVAVRVRDRGARFVAMLVAVLLVASGFLLGSATPSQAATITHTFNGITYSVDDASLTAEIVDYDSDYGFVVQIPASITPADGKTYTVTTIGNNAFIDKLLMGVTIPDSVTTIGNNVFAYNLLTEVTIPNSVTTIGDGAFYLNQLTKVTIPDSVTTIGNYAFYLNQLTKVTIPNSVTTIGNYAFYNNRLTEVTIPGSVTTLGTHAFGINRLTEVTIPGSVTTIGDYAFARNLLTEVTIPNSVTTISNGAFSGNLLEEVTISDSVTTISDYAFNDNRLTEVTIPGLVTTIGNYAFSGNLLTEVTIPDSVTTMGNSVFAYNRLTEVTTPDSVTTIGHGAFAYNLLTEVTIPDSVTTIGDGAFENNRLTEVTIPGLVTTIGNYAFYNNRLTEVTIPDSVTTMGDGAFGGNPDLSLVAFEGAAPSTFTPGIPGDARTGSLGDPETGVVVTYLKQYESTGFTSPVWQGYSSRAILEDFTVTFDTHGGSDIDPATVTDGDTITKPADPTRDGFTFTGWYTSTDTTTANVYDFTAPVTGDLTLHAGWEQNPAAVFTVTFDTHGGSDIDPATVTDGDTITKPADPTRGGFTFTGWYTSTDTTTATVYDFTAPVTGDLTLHAGWEANPAASTSNVGKGPGETTLAATGGNPAPWFPVTAMILLTAGILVLVYRSRRGTSNP